MIQVDTAELIHSLGNALADGKGMLGSLTRDDGRILQEIGNLLRRHSWSRSVNDTPFCASKGFIAFEYSDAELVDLATRLISNLGFITFDECLEYLEYERSGVQVIADRDGNFISPHLVGELREILEATIRGRATLSPLSSEDACDVVDTGSGALIATLPEKADACQVAAYCVSSLGSFEAVDVRPSEKRVVSHRDYAAWRFGATIVSNPLRRLMASMGLLSRPSMELSK